MFKRIVLCFLSILLLASCAPAGPAQLVIDEHLLTAAPDISTDHLVFHFAQGDQAALLARTGQYRNFRAQVLDYDRRALEPFGYQLKSRQASDNGPSHEVIDIYRGDQLIAGDVDYMGLISLNASHTDFLGLVEIGGDSFNFTAKKFEKRPWLAGPEPYGYVGDRLMTVEISDVSHGVSRLRTYLADQTVYDTQFNNISTYGAYDTPVTYGDHWALILIDANMTAPDGPEPYDRLIQDGQDVNAVRGYQQAFEFSGLDGRPFYFYQKDGKIGISFNGQELARGYDEIPHYNCCSPALLNPGKSMNMVWFFARRGSDWYYVEAYVPARP